MLDQQVFSSRPYCISSFAFQCTKVQNDRGIVQIVRLHFSLFLCVCVKRPKLPMFETLKHAAPSILERLLIAYYGSRAHHSLPCRAGQVAHCALASKHEEYGSARVAPKATFESRVRGNSITANCHMSGYGDARTCAMKSKKEAKARGPILLSLVIGQRPVTRAVNARADTRFLCGRSRKKPRSRK